MHTCWSMPSRSQKRGSCRNFQKWLTFYHVDARTQAQVVRLGNKIIYWLSRLDSQGCSGLSCISEVIKINCVKYLDLLEYEELNFWPRKLQVSKKETGPLPSFIPVCLHCVVRPQDSARPDPCCGCPEVILRHSSPTATERALTELSVAPAHRVLVLNPEFLY